MKYFVAGVFVGFFICGMIAVNLPELFRLSDLYYNSCEKVCAPNDGVSYVFFNGDCECNNGAYFDEKDIYKNK